MTNKNKVSITVNEKTGDFKSFFYEAKDHDAQGHQLKTGQMISVNKLANGTYEYSKLNIQYNIKGEFSGEIPNEGTPISKTEAFIFMRSVTKPDTNFSVGVKPVGIEFF